MWLVLGVNQAINMKAQFRLLGLNIPIVKERTWENHGKDMGLEYEWPGRGMGGIQEGHGLLLYLKWRFLILVDQRPWINRHDFLTP